MHSLTEKSMTKPMTDERLKQLESVAKVSLDELSWGQGWTQEEYKEWLIEACKEIRRLREENKRLSLPLPIMVEQLTESNRELREENERLLKGAYAPFASEESGHMLRCAKVNGVWNCDKRCIKAKYERARELLEKCLEDGVGYLELHNNIRAFLDGEDQRSANAEQSSRRLSEPLKIGDYEVVYEV